MSPGTFWTLFSVLSVVVLALAVALYLLFRRYCKLEGRYRSLMAGAEGRNLEQVLTDQLAELRAATAGAEALPDKVATLEATLRTAIQHVGVVRFNPFGDRGGDFSFALALADADGNGCLLCSLHGRGEARLFAKPLERWSSSYALSEEETEAVHRARMIDKDTPSH